jgi:transposase
LLLTPLLHAPLGSRLVSADFDGHALTLGIATTQTYASCPLCGVETWRVHSRYTRKLAEEPVLGHSVRLQMTVRRFLCSTSSCPRRIFAEPLDDFAAKHARTTAGLAQTHHAIGAALGGEAGARLAAKTAMPTSPDTLLRRVKQANISSPKPLRFVGIDDWAWCKGQRYGTIVVDLETSAVVDLLPDRDAATVSAWLRAHPAVELVSRDRSSVYSQAASEAAPKAQQVADRWHLLKNVREAVEHLFERQYSLIADALKPADPDPNSQADASSEVHRSATTTLESNPQPSPSSSLPASPREEAALAKRRRRIEQFERVHELRRQDTPIRTIARELGMSRNSVRRYLRRQQCPDWSPGRRRRRSRLDTHREWIDAHIAEGRINAADLRRELDSQGIRCSYAAVQRYLNTRLGRTGKGRLRANATKLKPALLPSAKQLSFDWVRRPEKHSAEVQARLVTIRLANFEFAAALETLDEFTALIRKRSPGTLKEWLSRAEVSPCPEVRSFAESIRRDESAVNAVITTRWSNGPVEGHVNRLKTIKRQMYGRAGFTLLRLRLLQAA